MEILKYSEKMKVLQRGILIFLDKYENIEENYQNLINLINDHNIRTNFLEFESFLTLLLRISNNHHRTPNFFDKISQIFQEIKTDIIKYYSNSEIFEFFHTNKKLILLLIENEILKIDESIVDTMKKGKFKISKYIKFFLPEINGYDSNEPFENYKQKRLEGENDQEICELIRKDLIEEFIIFQIKNGIPIESHITSSIFETNPYLMIEESITLIEYAAFFGSTQIFKYLSKNGAKLTSSLWLYSIHSDNPEMIHLLEENHVEPENQSYEKCLEEAIKCHHNDVANYFIENYIKNDQLKKNIENDFDHNIYSYSIHYFNCIYFPEAFDHKYSLFYIIEYGNLKLVKLFLKYKKLNLSETVISMNSFFRQSFKRDIFLIKFNCLFDLIKFFQDLKIAFDPFQLMKFHFNYF